VRRLPQGQKIVGIGPIGRIRITREEGNKGIEVFVVNSSLVAKHVLCGPSVLDDMGDKRTYLDGHGYGLELERVNNFVACNPNNAWAHQVDHRLLLNGPVQRRDRELGFVGVGPLGGNLGPNLRAGSILLGRFNDPDTYQLCDVSTKITD